MTYAVLKKVEDEEAFLIQNIQMEFNDYCKKVNRWL